MFIQVIVEAEAFVGYVTIKACVAVEAELILNFGKTKTSICVIVATVLSSLSPEVCTPLK